LRRLSGGEGAPAELVTVRGELEIRPAREAGFGQVHQALSAIRAAHIRAALLLPSVQPSLPSAPAAPAAGNQAASRP
jgi:hypothetical protein